MNAAKYKPQIKATRAELEGYYQESQRALQALQEWFYLTTKAAPVTTITVDHADVGEVYRVHVLGLDRCAGGVVTVEHMQEPWTETPRYLDDLIGMWTRHHSPYLQHAARKLCQLQHDMQRAREAARSTNTQAEISP